MMILEIVYEEDIENDYFRKDYCSNDYHEIVKRTLSRGNPEISPSLFMHD